MQWEGEKVPLGMWLFVSGGLASLSVLANEIGAVRELAIREDAADFPELRCLRHLAQGQGSDLFRKAIEWNRARVKIVLQPPANSQRWELAVVKI